jgi:hypothetical protein
MVNYRYNTYILYGKNFRPILARKEAVDKLTSKLKKQGFKVKRVARQDTERLKRRKWVYY